MIKDENSLDKYMTVWQKKINSELIYNKKHLKTGKRFNTKESFQCLNIPVIFSDSVYKTDGNYYPKVFLEKFVHNFF